MVEAAWGATDLVQRPGDEVIRGESAAVLLVPGDHVRHFLVQAVPRHRPAGHSTTLVQY